jgi:hypothetical protein
MHRPPNASAYASAIRLSNLPATARQSIAMRDKLLVLGRLRS